MKYGKNRETAYVNGAIIAANMLYFIFLEWAGSTEDTYFMLEHGAMFGPAVAVRGEYWRLVTSMFMHFGIHHIVNNMLILYVLGGSLERALGKIKYLLFYFMCGIGANAVSLAVNLWKDQRVVSAGASGAVFGVIGGLLYAVMVNRGRLENLDARQLVIMVLFSLYSGFTSSSVNNVAHVSGLAVGILMSMILYRKPSRYSGG